MTGTYAHRMAQLTGWMLSRDVAKALGVKTNTLAKWRLQGRGPRGWKRTSPTTVHYTVDSVVEFQNTWHSDPSAMNADASKEGRS